MLTCLQVQCKDVRNQAINLVLLHNHPTHMGLLRNKVYQIKGCEDLKCLVLLAWV